jgi:heme A synthase
MNGWGFVIVVFLILTGAWTRIDCALGVQGACTEISERYPLKTKQPIDPEKALTNAITKTE